MGYLQVTVTLVSLCLLACGLQGELVVRKGEGLDGAAGRRGARERVGVEQLRLHNYAVCISILLIVCRGQSITSVEAEDVTVVFRTEAVLRCTVEYTGASSIGSVVIEKAEGSPSTTV